MRRFSLALILLFTAACASAQTPTVAAGGVLNGASFAKGQPVTPGSLVTIFGSQLAARTAQADTIPLSNSLGGVSVSFVSDSKTVAAPMLFVNPDPNSQINAQVPWDLVPAGSTATVNVIVSRDGVASAPAPVNIGPFSPGIFASNGRAIAVNADGTLAWPSGVIAGLTTHPAKVGDTVIVYATGLGAVDSTPANGAGSLDKLRQTLTKPTVMIGGVTAVVPFSGLSPQFVGVNQLNITIPNANPGDNVPIQLQLGGITSPDGITIAISQ